MHQEVIAGKHERSEGAEEAEMADPVWNLEFAKKVSTNGFFFRTAINDSSLDPVKFEVEGRLDDGEWETIGLA